MLAHLTEKIKKKAHVFAALTWEKNRGLVQPASLISVCFARVSAYDHTTLNTPHLV